MVSRVDKMKYVLEIMYLKYGATEKVVRLSQALDKLIVKEQMKRLNY